MFGFFGGADKMLVEKVVEVYLGKDLRLQTVLDTFGLEFVLEDSNFHQKQSDHPFFHENFKMASDILNFLTLEEIS
jgi:hypothetical protein